MDKYRVFELADGRVSRGAVPLAFVASGWMVTTIQVGETGRGRQLGVLPVEGAPSTTIPCPEGEWWWSSPSYPLDRMVPCPTCGLPREETAAEGSADRRIIHGAGGTVKKYAAVKAASLGQTRGGKAKMMFAEEANSEEFAIIVLRTGMGYRGGNSHTGDTVPGGAFGVFPGQWLVQGVIAEGDAGKMGSGDQGVALVPRGQVFRVALQGRCYGKPCEWFAVFDGRELRVCGADTRGVLPDEHPLAGGAA